MPGERRAFATRNFCCAAVKDPRQVEGYSEEMAIRIPL